MSLTKEDYDFLALLLQQFAIPGHSLSYQSPSTFNKTIREKLVPRNRFNNDHHDTCMYIARSKNLNVVAYTANLVEIPADHTPLPLPNPNNENNNNENEDGLGVEYHPKKAQYTTVASGAYKNAILKQNDTVHAYFINLEPSYIAARRAKGIEYDCDDLNYIERTMAYGCSTSPVVVLERFGEVFYKTFSNNNNNNHNLLDAFFAEGPTQNFFKELSQRSSAVKIIVEEDMNNNNNKHEGKIHLLSWLSALRVCFAKFVALPTWPGLLLCLPPLEKNNNNKDDNEDNNTFFAADDTVPVIVAAVMGELSVLDHVFVSSIEPQHFYQLPSVEYIETFGVNLITGVSTYEKKTNK